MSRRSERVAAELQEEVARLIREELHDPRLGRLVTIAHVTLSEDLQHATVWVSVLDDASTEEALDALRSSAGYIRRGVGHQLKLKYAPEIRFELDQAVSEGDRVLALLDTIDTEETP